MLFFSKNLSFLIPMHLQIPFLAQMSILRTNQQDLAKLHTAFYRYKDRPNAPENIKAITDSITSEYDHVFNIKLPQEIGDGLLFSTTMVYRKHIPEGKLSGSILPIIACPSFLKSNIILPKKYWTTAFTCFFVSNSF